VYTGVGLCPGSACLFNALVALVALRLRPQDAAAHVPQYNFMLIATTYVGAMYGSSTALKFVSFPTQVRANWTSYLPSHIRVSRRLTPAACQHCGHCARMLKAAPPVAPQQSLTANCLVCW
jgi:hypothetical protein